jgi:hypothetical protein
MCFFMREFALGHWNYFTWHLPATVLTLVCIGLVVVMARSLRRNAFSRRERALRIQILGWSALIASLGSGIAWPYLVSAARVRVDASGTWHVSNYLGIPLARVDASQVREVRGVDLGGVGMGTGYVEIRMPDGHVIRSVRVDRDTLDGLRRALGYTSEWVRNVYGDQVIVAHRYDAQGPVR